MNRRGFIRALGAAVSVAATLRLSSIPELVIERASFPVGWVITDEEIEDNLYGEISKRYTEALAESMLTGRPMGIKVEHDPLRMESRLLT